MRNKPSRYFSVYHGSSIWFVCIASITTSGSTGISPLALEMVGILFSNSSRFLTRTKAYVLWHTHVGTSVESLLVLYGGLLHVPHLPIHRDAMQLASWWHSSRARAITRWVGLLQEERHRETHRIDLYSLYQSAKVKKVSANPNKSSGGRCFKTWSENVRLSVIIYHWYPISSLT